MMVHWLRKDSTQTLRPHFAMCAQHNDGPLLTHGDSIGDMCASSICANERPRPRPRPQRLVRPLQAAGDARVSSVAQCNGAGGVGVDPLTWFSHHQRPPNLVVGGRADFQVIATHLGRLRPRKAAPPQPWVRACLITASHPAPLSYGSSLHQCECCPGDCSWFYGGLLPATSTDKSQYAPQVCGRKTTQHHIYQPH